MDQKFKTGQQVTMERSKMFSSAPGSYRIISVLPESAGRRQYRIKSELERHERVVDETQLQLMLDRA